MWIRFWSTKFLLTIAMLAGVFALKFRDIDVSDLSVVLPLILGFYTFGNVSQSYVDNKYGHPPRAFQKNKRVGKKNNELAGDGEDGA